jgi:cytochrome P450
MTGSGDKRSAMSDRREAKPSLHDPQFLAGDPFPAFRRLRAEAPVYWHEPPGFWALSRHEDVVAVSRDPATFCSSQGILLSDIERPVVPRQSIVYIDPPEHVKYRKLVQPAFSPGRIRALEQDITALVTELCDRIPRDTAIDFVDAFAVPLPLLVIADMLGIPGDDRVRFKRWSDAIIEAGTQSTPDNMAQSVELLGYFGEIIAARRVQPADDLISVLVHSEVDGERLEEFDLLMFCMTLLVAGNETTRNLLSHGALALATNPDQRELLARDAALMPGAVEEMLRWGSPVASFMRRATRDTELRGISIRAGDRLLLQYVAANRDEAVFGDDAEEFRVTRDASHHLAFGFGEHFCLGAQLARMEARIAFAQLLARFGQWELAGEVERLPSLFLRGIERLPLRFAAD